MDRTLTQERGQESQLVRSYLRLLVDIGHLTFDGAFAICILHFAFGVRVRVVICRCGGAGKAGQRRSKRNNSEDEHSFWTKATNGQH